MPEDYSDLFDPEMPFKDTIHRVSYHTDVSNYSADQDTGDSEPLSIENKGFMVNDTPDVTDSQKSMELKEDLGMVAESVDRGYADLDRASKIKVFKELLKEYKDPILARQHLTQMIRAADKVEEPVPGIVSEFREALIEDLELMAKHDPDEFDLDELVSVASAWEKSPILENKFVCNISPEGPVNEDMKLSAEDLRTAGFRIPEGMERVGETEENFVKYLVEKYAMTLSFMETIAIKHDANLLDTLQSIQEESWTNAMDDVLSGKIPPSSVGFRRLF